MSKANFSRSEALIINFDLSHSASVCQDGVKSERNAGKSKPHPGYIAPEV